MSADINHGPLPNTDLPELISIDASTKVADGDESKETSRSRLTVDISYHLVFQLIVLLQNTESLILGFIFCSNERRSE